jgi:DUF1009 family protein
LTEIRTTTDAGLNTAPLSVIAGGGEVPLIVARAARAAGRSVQIIGIEGEATAGIAEFPHHWQKWGHLGRVLDLLSAHGGEIVIVGSISGRPDFRSIGLDIGTAKYLPEILSVMAKGGDDSILSGAVKFLERRGFNVVGAHQVAHELVAESGCLTRTQPSDAGRRDAAVAAEAAQAIGRLDAGQAAVAVGGHVVALEGSEGTDAMLARVKQLRESKRIGWRGHAGVLAKFAKPQQDLRVDMPAIGPRTVDAVADAGLAGIFVEAGKVMLVERPEIIARADKAGIFVLAGAAQTGKSG